MYRFLWHTHKRTVSIMLKASFIAITISCCGLVVGDAIMKGLHQTTLNSLKQGTPDITIQAKEGKELDTTVLIKKLKTLIPSSAQLFSYTQTPLILIAQGATPLPGLFIQSSKDAAHELFPLLDIHNKNNKKNTACIVHPEIYHQYQDKKTRTMGALFAHDDIDESSDCFTHIKLPVSGTDKSLTSPSSEALIWSDKPLIESPYTTTIIGINTKTKGELTHIHKTLKNSLPASLIITTWEEQYPELGGALALEQYAFYAIMAIILLITAIILGCFVALFIDSKAKTISLLMLHGMSKKQVMGIFGSIIVIITAAATFVGSFLGFMLSWSIEYFRLIPLSETIYYTDHLPAILSLKTLFLPGLIFIPLSIFLALYALKKISIQSSHFR